VGFDLPIHLIFHFLTTVKKISNRIKTERIIKINTTHFTSLVQFTFFNI